MLFRSDINLGGIIWNPVAFSGKFVSDNSTPHTISNFKIVANTPYAGFFSKLSSATIKDIKFSDVTISNTSRNECIGVVVGYISGTTTISGVCVNNSAITASTKYAGLISGYIANAYASIENCSALNSSINANILYSGGISARAGVNTTINNCKTSSIALKGIDYVGGVVGMNAGVISNCNVAGQIQSVSTSTNVAYFGGLVGFNLDDSKLSKSIAHFEIAVLNNTAKESLIFYYVGGLVGYNKGSVSQCAVYSNQISGSNSSSATHIGGLVGYNNCGQIEYCFANIDTLGETRANIYTSGIAGYNYGGAINGCWVCIKNINGYVVSGLVRVNSNKGTVDSCASVGATLDSRSTYKGVHTVGFVYDMVNGTVSNCLVKANLTGTYDSGWMAGIAGFMPYTNGTFGTITTSIADISLGGKGAKYLELAEDGLMKKKRTTGTISNCVISKDALVDGVFISEYDNEFMFWGTATPGSGSNYIVATEAEMKNIETYLDTKKCNFDITAGDLDSKWLITTDRVPQPRAITKAFTGAAG